MNILGIETSTDCSSIALITDEGRFSAEGSSGRHSRTLFTDCERLLAEAGITVSDLDAAAAGLGPGSYTGIRVAVTAVKSLAWALDIPAGGISSYQALAAQVAGNVDHDLIYITGDARMNELFVGEYTVSDGCVREQFLETVKKERLDSILKPGSCIAGPGACLCSEYISGEYTVFENRGNPSALAVISETERCLGFSPVMEAGLEPLYLKKSEPERKKAAQNK